MSVVTRRCPLSVVMPVYNEDESIEAAVAEVLTEVLDVVPGSDLWIVDDGSRDRTPGILDALAATDPRLHVVHQANGGHGAALLTGLNRCGGDWILLVDSDRQILLEGFQAAWHTRHGVDAVFGERSQREDPLVRRVVSAVLKLELLALFGVAVADANAPFKLISRTLWEQARETIPASCLIPSVFLAVYPRRARLPFAEAAVTYRKRSAGRTTLRKLKLLKFSARSFGQLVAFRMTRVSRAGAGVSPIPAPAVKKL